MFRRKRYPYPDPAIGVGDLERNSRFVSHRSEPEGIDGHPAADELDGFSYLEPVSHPDEQGAVGPCLLDDADEVMGPRIA